jgi:hypothetical protein
MEVSGQLNAAAALPQEKELIVPTGEEPFLSTHGLSDAVFSLPEIEPPILRTSGLCMPHRLLTAGAKVRPQTNQSGLERVL